MSEQQTMSELKQQALVDINEANDERALQEVKVKYLGKKGQLAELMKLMKDLPNEDKPAFGQKVNELRQTIQNELDERQQMLVKEKLNKQLAEETIDVSLPGRHIEIGSKHPLTRTIEEIEDLFLGLGYEIVNGYEVEQDHYNFEMLNLPKSHPARDMQDSFILRMKFYYVRIHHQCRHVRWNHVMVKVQLKLFALVKCIVVTLMMRHIVINLHKSKD